jgi:hypothetical protein
MLNGVNIRPMRPPSTSAHRLNPMRKPFTSVQCVRTPKVLGACPQGVRGVTPY